MRDPISRTIPVAQCFVDPANPNKMTPAQLKALIKSIQKYGFNQPIWVRKEKNLYRIIDGAHRYAALKRLRIKTVSAKVFDVSDADVKILRQVANKLHGKHQANLDRKELASIVGAGREKLFRSLLPRPTFKPRAALKPKPVVRSKPASRKKSKLIKINVVNIADALAWDFGDAPVRIACIRSTGKGKTVYIRVPDNS